MVNETSEDYMNRNRQSLQVAQNYYKWILGLFPFEKGKRILDIGCGPCLYYKEIVELQPQTYLATDFSSYFLSLVEELFVDHDHYETCQLNILEDTLPQNVLNRRFDHLLCFDVLEHLEDDEKALLNIKRIMLGTQAKYLFLRVPALQYIYGENDRAIGHFRRYSKKSLSSLITKCGFHINKIRYQNFMGIFPWYFIGKILKRSEAVLNNNGLANEGSLINIVSPFLCSIENMTPPPIGLSLYSICEVI